MSEIETFFIYVIGKADGARPVKIGISQIPRARLKTLQTGCPFKLRLLHLRKCRNRDHALEHEKSFHHIYRAKRLQGEWFNVDLNLASSLIDINLAHEAHFEQQGNAA